MSLAKSLVLAALIVGAWIGPGFAQAPKPGAVGYRGKSFDAASLPAELGPAAKRAIGDWSAWAKQRGYRMDLDPSRRVLLLSTRGNVDAPMGLIVKTIAFFDGLFPSAVTPGSAPDGASVGPAVTTPLDAPDEIPEDPEGPPPGAPKTLPSKPEDRAAAVATAPFRADAVVAVMVIAKNSDDYTALLDQLTTTHPYLGDWKAGATGQIGFVLERPLCGAYNENSPGQEEWNPDNELVHRTMALLVLRRFSEQPYWLRTALCWQAEMTIAKSIYCMPHRDGFVSVGEHGGWLASLNSWYSDRSSKPLVAKEFMLRRGTWDERVAKTAFGMAEFAIRAYPRALGGLLEEFRRYREQHGRQTAADGTWTSIRDYEIPDDATVALLERYLGASVLQDAILFWISGVLPKAR